MSLKRTGLSRSTLYRKVENGTFPGKSISPSAALAGASLRSIRGWQIAFFIQRKTADKAVQTHRRAPSAAATIVAL
ncbi:MAG: AlpA family phage regulatory protein [Pseudomonadota bacterium]